MRGRATDGFLYLLLAGFVSTVLWFVLFEEVNLCEMLPGFVVGFLVTIGVSLFTEAPEGAAEEHEAVWRAVGKASWDSSESNNCLRGHHLED